MWYLSILFLCFSIYFTQDTPRRVDAIPSFGSSIDKSSTHGAFCVMEPEVWRDVEQFPNHYQVSSYGRVRSKDRIVDRGIYGKIFRAGQIRILSKNKHGRIQVMLSVNGEVCNRLVSILVAKEFVPNPDDKPQVGHIDNDPENNHYTNLVWCTQKENMQHCSKCGRRLPTNAVKVVQMDKDQNIIRTFDKLLDVKAFGFSDLSVSRAVRGLNKTAGGFIWKRAEDVEKLTP